mmetsp:Transcript_26744/g.25762  ORF Transcript_26744/g.25762 Transcript_26744/m.25762 type:complete len:717 (+) Transcript_26744:491-2641(+)
MYLFLFPARSGVLELTHVILLSGLYGAGMTYLAHSYTIEVFTGESDSSGQLVSLVLLLIVVLFSSYSLFSKPIIESTPYLQSDNFSLFSHHYQRIYYSLILCLVAVILEAREVAFEMSMFPYYLNLIFLLLQMLGILSNPFVLLVWAMEQIDVHVYGATYRASDSRILFSFLVNTCAIALCVYLYQAIDFEDYILLVVAILAFCSSNNLFFSLGIIKPFQVSQEKSEFQRKFTEVVLEKSKPFKAVAQGSSSSSLTFTFLRVFIRVVLMLLLTAGAAYLLGSSLLFDPTEGLVYAFIGAAALIALVLAGLSILYRVSFCRCLGCCSLKGAPNFYLTFALKYLMMACMIVGASHCFNIYIASLGTLSEVSEYLFPILFLYRAFNRVFHSPMISSLELTEFLIFQILNDFDPAYSNLMYLFLCSFVTQRVVLFIKKVDFVMVSLVTAFKNKKQRFKRQCLCFTLQFTLLLPFFLLVLAFTTLFDTPTVPYLGFAYFIIGYPRPKRGWSDITPVAANPNDSRSDGHLYQAMLPQLTKSIKEMANRDLFSFLMGEYYLLKNEKMIILVQVLEYGNNYLAYTMKGTELQETTVCHAEENENINQISEAIFKNKANPLNYAFSLTPVKQVSFAIYDDSKVQLTGIIDNPEFASLLKKAYLRILMLKMSELIKETPGLKFYKIMKGPLSKMEADRIAPFFEQAFFTYLNLASINFQTVKERIP